VFTGVTIMRMCYVPKSPPLTGYGTATLTFAFALSMPPGTMSITEGMEMVSNTCRTALTAAACSALRGSTKTSGR
jgi:hypothetical protein